MLTFIKILGPSIGVVAIAPLAGYLCEYGFGGGWPSVFYTTGAIGLVWTAGWFFFITDKPAEHPTITEEERTYIEESCQAEDHDVSLKALPIKAMLSSTALWAFVVAHFCFNWNYYTVLICLSTYLSDVLHLPPSMNGVITSLPYIAIFLTTIISALVADTLTKQCCSTTTIRKVYYISGMCFSSGALILISFLGCDIILIVCILCFAVGSIGIAQNGCLVNNVDIAPNYAGILMGISNSIGSIPGIVSPMLTGSIINNSSTVDTWRTVFYIATGFSAFGSTFFAIFGQGKVQEWAKAPPPPALHRQWSRSGSRSRTLSKEHKLSISLIQKQEK